MSWTYDITKLREDSSDGTLARIRLKIGDVDVVHKLMQDEEILFIYGTEGDENELQTSIFCVAKMVANAAKQISYAIGPEVVQAQMRFTQFQKLLEQLQKEAKGVSRIKLSQPVSHDPYFKFGQFNNPRNPW